MATKGGEGIKLAPRELATTVKRPGGPYAYPPEAETPAQGPPTEIIRRRGGGETIVGLYPAMIGTNGHGERVVTLMLIAESRPKRNIRQEVWRRITKGPERHRDVVIIDTVPPMSVVDRQHAKTDRDGDEGFVRTDTVIGSRAPFEVVTVVSKASKTLSWEGEVANGTLHKAFVSASRDLGNRESSIRGRRKLRKARLSSAKVHLEAVRARLGIG